MPEKSTFVRAVDQAPGPKSLIIEIEAGRAVEAIHAKSLALGMQTNNNQTQAIGTITMTLDNDMAIYVSLTADHMAGQIEIMQRIEKRLREIEEGDE